MPTSSSTTTPEWVTSLSLDGLIRLEGQVIRSSGDKLKQLGLTNTIRMDRGGQGKSAKMDAYLTSVGIKPEYTSAHSSGSNAPVERRIGILQERSRSIRLGAIGGALPEAAWAECFNTACFLTNILPTSCNPGYKSPYEMVHKKPFNVASLRRIGATCFVKTHQSLKLPAVSRKGRMLGYSAISHCYRILLSDGRVIESDDVTFLKDELEEPTIPDIATTELILTVILGVSPKVSNTSIIFGFCGIVA